MINRVTLLGNLGRDPEIRTMQNGDKLCTLSVATSEGWRDKNSGEWREKVEWHRIVIWNQNLVKVAEQYLHKGSKVYLEGMLETRKWIDQSNQDRYTTEVVLKQYNSTLKMLDSRSEREAAAAGNGNERKSLSQEMNDEIPF